MKRTERIRRKKPIVPVKKKKVDQKKEVIVDTGRGSSKRSSVGRLYDTQYKKLLIIPFLFLVLSLASIAYQNSVTGDFLYRDVSLKGGVLLTIPTSISSDELLVLASSEFPTHSFEARSLADGGEQLAVTLTSDITSDSELDVLVVLLEQSTGVSRNLFSIESIGSSLGVSFFEQTLKALFAAFLFMGFVVFLYFGEGKLVKVIVGVGTLLAAMFMFSTSDVLNILSLVLGVGLIVAYARFSIPSLAVVLAAFSNIVITLAIVNLFGMKIGTAGIAAFLMLIGYSVDTDILLSTRVLKRAGGSVYDRVISALQTGVTMNVTTIAALTVTIVFSQSEVISQIMTILLIGLFVDMLNTWIQNVGILRWYLEKRGGSS